MKTKEHDIIGKLRTWQNWQTIEHDIIGKLESMIILTNYRALIFLLRWEVIHYLFINRHKYKCIVFYKSKYVSEAIEKIILFEVVDEFNYLGQLIQYNLHVTSDIYFRLNHFLSNSSRYINLNKITCQISIKSVNFSNYFIFFYFIIFKINIPFEKFLFFKKIIKLKIYKNMQSVRIKHQGH